MCIMWTSLLLIAFASFIITLLTLLISCIIYQFLKMFDIIKDGEEWEDE